MTSRVASISEQESPELAVLDVLEATLDASERILRIVHPAMNPYDPCPHRLINADPSVWMAEALCDQAEAMTRAISQYRLARQLERNGPTTLDPF
jgi:hypothetical protein